MTRKMRAPMSVLLGAVCIPLLLAGCWEKTGISCPDDWEVCDGVCVDSQTDTNNCGGCGTECDADQVCTAGACVDACDSGLDMCGTGCVDLQSNPLHCGSCDNDCDPGEVCGMGACALFCPGDLTDCSGACVDTDTNRFHCGACSDASGSNACAAGQICNVGTCELTCGGSTPTLCGDACVNTDIDRNNCGGCDDGNGSNTCDATEICSSGTCTINFLCGNSVIDPGEVCDDGNTLAGDGCSANCTSLEVCGNATLDASTGEACDDGNNIDGDGCQANCALPSCGDNILDPGEVCDDGDNTSGDGCNATCTSLEICGNGILDATELCDDGNTTNGDGCQFNCLLPLCGDGVVDPGEVCDDGNTASGDGTCDASCLSDESCGNSVLDVNEACDDGNSTDGDGCQADCTLPNCGDGVLDPGEVCDDGNNTDGDGTCNGICTSDESCGNSVLDVGEQCDDGNTTPGDGCDANCNTDCAGGLTLCSTVCVDTDHDPNNCGGCANVPNAGDNICAPENNTTAYCVPGGTCGYDCDPGFADCGGGADCETDIWTDPNNCGSCGNVCAASMVCGNGMCHTPILLLNTATGSLSQSSRGAANSPGSMITVGGTDKIITEISVLVDLTSAGNMKFVIFDHATQVLLWVSPPKAFTDTGNTWKTSDPLYFVLQAGTTYDIGAIADVGGEWSYDGTAENQNGLSTTVTNPNFSDFTSPTLSGSASADGAVRLTGY